MNKNESKNNKKIIQSIDNVNKTFKELEQDMGKYYLELVERMKNPILLKTFGDGVGEKGILKCIENHYRISVQSELSGCYVFSERNIAKYVGISRSIGRRIYQHLKGAKHNQATLAYKIAEKNTGLQNERQVNMNNNTFIEEFDKAKKQILSWEVSVIKMNNPVEMYLFELYAALKLNTYEFNTFETH